jgi:hypothetical protein
MARNILLDTNILKQLVSPTGFSPYLEQLVTWQKQNDVTIYCPKTLKSEWYKHREVELKKINAAIKNHQQDIKKSALFKVTPDIDEVKLDVADKILSAQVSAIDKLLGTAVQINNERQAAGLMWEQKMNKKAPFRKKENSENDAVILFSTLDEIVRAKEVSLHFFSSNHTDYAAPGNEDSIHPDLSTHYPFITIFYHADMAKGFDELVELGLPSSKKQIKAGKVTVKKFFQEDETKTIGDRLEDYIYKRFSDINFLPKRLFCVHSPIIIGEEYTDRQRSFTMNTDNQEIYNLFLDTIEQSKVRISSKTEQNEMGYEGQGLIQFFRSNLVYKITYLDGNALVLPTKENVICKCAVCTFRRSRYKESFQMLEAIEADVPTMKKAYILYLHGDWKESVLTLIDLAKSAEEKGEWVTYYIAKYNLLLLSRLLRFQNKDESLPESLLAELRETNMDEVLLICRQASLNDILDHLHYGHFLNDANDRMQVLVTRLKDYQVDRTQGWSDDTSNIIELYYESVLFMEQNYLMIDSYSNITTLTETFVEGLFASYVCEKTLKGKLSHLTDFIIKKIVAYGKHDDIIKYKKRYGIKLIKYELSKGSSSLVNEIEELCKSYKFIADWSGQKDYVGMSNVWTRFRRIFNNSLTMAAILEMSDIDIVSICRDIIPLLRIQKHLQSYDLTKTLSFFLRHKGHQVTDVMLEDFFYVAYNSETIEFDQLLQVFSRIYKKRKVKLQVSEEWWKKFSSEYFVDFTIQNSEQKTIELINLYGIVANDTYKSDILDFLILKLKNKFDRNIYYSAVMIGNFAPTDELTKEYESETFLLAKKGRDARLYDSGFYNDYRLDEFINFSLYLERPLSPELIKALGELDEYYKWVTDLDAFDYEKFNTDWLSNHLTIYSKNHFRKSRTLKVALRSIVMESKDSFLGQLYIDLYSPLD